MRILEVYDTKQAAKEAFKKLRDTAPSYTKANISDLSIEFSDYCTVYFKCKENIVQETKGATFDRVIVHESMTWNEFLSRVY